MLRRPLLLLIAAAACAATAAVVYVLALHVDAVQRVDVRVVEGSTGLGGARSATAAGWLVDVFKPLWFGGLIAIVLGIGVARRRPAVGVTAAAAMLGANLTTQLLKPVLAAPRAESLGRIDPGSWPSGHATAAMSLALALVLVSPPRLRTVAVGAGAVVAVAMGYAVLLLESHYPTDVAGGYLVAGAWTCLAAAVAVLSGSGPAPTAAPSRRRPR